MKRRIPYALLALQVVFLTGLYFHYAGAQKENTIRLRCLPVDPRDLLRGNYLTINLEIARLPVDSTGEDFLENEEVFVLLRPDAEFWVIDAISREAPQTGLRWLRARYREGRLRYDMEKYFIPENTPQPPPSGTLFVEAAIRPGGRGQLLRVFHNGQPWPVPAGKD